MKKGYRRLYTLKKKMVGERQCVCIFLWAVCVYITSSVEAHTVTDKYTTIERYIASDRQWLSSNLVEVNHKIRGHTLIDTGLSSSSPSSASSLSSLSSTPSSTNRNAYGTILYVGTPRDYEFYVAARVLLQSLARLSANADLILIASIDVPHRWAHTFASEGVRVVRVPNLPNPYKHRSDFNQRFKHSLNKVYAWRLVDYERIVMLDADNVFMRNTDELFLCGQFCAVFIDPCIFHTGLFVLEPSNKVFKEMYNYLSTGKLESIDGADQGFLTSYFHSLLDKPLFYPPGTNSTRLNGYFRLPLGYQMDASYYYIRLKWRVPCGANSIIAFPSASWLKPWYWWSWPVLPLGLSWHDQRRATIGYADESSILLAQSFLYCAVLVLACAAWLGLVPVLHKDGDQIYKSCVPKRLWMKHEAMCTLFFARVLPPISVIASFFVPYWIIPTTSHPIAGWGVLLLGSLSILITLIAIFRFDQSPTLTPWLLIFVSLLVMAFPLYTNGIVRMLAIFGFGAFSTPFLWWSFRTLATGRCSSSERENGKSSPVHPKPY